ncbi:MAG: flavin reductase family protein [Sediminibacterium sp.]
MFLDFKQLSASEKQSWLNSAIGPRPICFASTMDANGQVNLAPFSYFNLFSSNPPIVIFSPLKSAADKPLKHSLQNVIEHPECVINIVDYSMVAQMSLSSCAYPKGVDEFTKVGFTKAAATMVQPPLVKEAKIQLECKVVEIKSLGEGPGAGQLVIAEVLCMHVAESVLGNDKKINPAQLNLVARLGGDWYCKVDASNLFEINKPNAQLGMGIDQLPEGIRNSPILTGNHLGLLANYHEVPAVDPAFNDERLKNIIQYYGISPTEMERELHQYAAELLNDNRIETAWQILISLENA